MLKLTRPCAFIDVETTGTLENLDRVIELGVHNVHPDGTITRWRSLFNPGMAIPLEATAVHGIDDARVASAPKFQDLAPGIWESLHGCDIGGFNVRFDIKMLRREFGRCGFADPFTEALIVDAMGIYHKNNPRDLGAAYNHYMGRPLDGHHTADVDAEAAYTVLLQQILVHGLNPDVISLAKASAPEKPANALDSEGKLILRNGEAVLTFGKHAGTPLRQVDQSYIDWMLKQDFPGELKVLIQSWR